MHTRSFSSTRGRRVLVGHSIYMPLSKHFATAKSSPCAMPRPRHRRLVPDARGRTVISSSVEMRGVRRYGRSRLESGMMISRRPKRRASSENAPGPSRTSATQMIARSRWVMELARAEPWLDGNRTRFMITFPTAANPQQIGVRNPNRIEPPIATARLPRHQEEAVSRSGEDKIKIPSAAALSATRNLRRRSPPPGNPFGKVENSLCSGLPPAP
jgi:hypothetical protein